MMLRFTVVLALAGAVLFCFSPPALAQTRDAHPWDARVTCPKCQSERVVYILYGEPRLDADLQRALDRHKVELGGCIITPESKRWECRDCEYKWGNVLK